MPRIPTLENNTLPTVSQAQVSVGAAGPAAFGAGIGQAVEGVGNTLQNVGARLGELALSIQRDTNRTEVTNALLNADQMLNDVQYNPETGYMSRAGVNAKGISGLLEKDIYKIRRQMSKGLQNPLQKELFDQAFARSAVGARMRTLSHEAGQMRVASIASLEGIVAQSRKAAFLDPNNQSTIDAALQSTFEANAKISELAGEPEEIAQLRNETAESQIHASVVDRFLQDQNVTSAQAYFDKTKERIDDDTRRTLSSRLTSGGERQQAAAGAQEAFDKFGVDGYAEGLAYIDEKYADNPVVRQQALNNFANIHGLHQNARAAQDAEWRNAQYESIYSTLRDGSLTDLNKIRDMLIDQTSERGQDVTGPMIGMIDRAFDAGQTQLSANQKQQQAQVDLAGDSVLKTWLSQVNTNGNIIEAEDPVLGPDGGVQRNPDGSEMTRITRRRLQTSDIIEAGAKLGMSVDAIEAVVKHHEGGGFSINLPLVEKIMRSEMSNAKLDINDPQFYGLNDALESVIGLDKTPTDEDYRQAIRTLLTPVYDETAGEYSTLLQQFQSDRRNNRFYRATQKQTDDVGDRLSVSEEQINAAMDRIRVYNALVKRQALEAVGTGDTTRVPVEIREVTRENALLLLTQELVGDTPLVSSVPPLDRNVEVVERTGEQQRRLDLQRATRRLGPQLQRQAFESLFPSEPNPFEDEFRRVLSPQTPADRLRQAIDAVEDLQVEAP